MFARFPVLYTVLRYVGGAYMLYLAWKIFRSQPATPADAPDAVAKPMGFLGSGGLPVGQLQGLGDGTGPVTTYLPEQHSPGQLLALVGLMGLINMPTTSTWALFGSSMRRYLQNPDFLRIFNTRLRWHWSLRFLSSTQFATDLPTENTMSQHPRPAKPGNSLPVQKMNPSVIREILKVTEKPGIISFAGGLLSPKTFPIAEFDAASQKVLREDGQAALQYAASAMPLREAVAAMLPWNVDPAQVLITTGSQQGLDLVAKILIDTDSKPWWKHPPTWAR